MWQLIFANIVLKVAVPESTIKCQDEQLCSGLKAGIDGVFHGVQAIWDKKSNTEDW